MRVTNCERRDTAKTFERGIESRHVKNAGSIQSWRQDALSSILEQRFPQLISWLSCSKYCRAHSHGSYGYTTGGAAGTVSRAHAPLECRSVLAPQDGSEPHRDAPLALALALALADIVEPGDVQLHRLEFSRGFDRQRLTCEFAKFAKFAVGQAEQTNGGATGIDDLVGGSEGSKNTSDKE